MRKHDNAQFYGLSTIISNCLKLDSMAFSQYRAFAKIAKDENDKKFWLSMADDEKSHINFWRKNQIRALNGDLPEIFDNSSELCENLERLISRFKGYQKTKKYDRKSAFETALDIESHLFSPDFLAMFRFFSENENTLEDYHQHVERFISEIKNSGEFSKLNSFIDNSYDLFKKNFELVIQSTEDPLTKLTNRRGFYEKVLPLLDLASRKANGVGIIVIDIDYFKKINDKFGHQEGDKVIVQIADIIKSSVRKYDIVCRFGGEEFIIFVITETAEELRALAERIRLKIRELVKTPDKIEVTASFGATFANVRTVSIKFLNELISDADNKLYTAKNTGRNRTII